MTSLKIPVCQQRLLKAWGETIVKHRQGLIDARPVLRDMIVIMQQEICRQDGYTPEEAGREIKVLGDLWDFIERLNIDEGREREKAPPPKRLNPQPT